MAKVRRYWGLAEVADACGVTRSAVSNWVARDKMPKPHIRLSSGPVWINEGEFAKWLKERRQDG